MLEQERMPMTEVLLGRPLLAGRRRLDGKVPFTSRSQLPTYKYL